jgi:hypothetical protein
VRVDGNLTLAAAVISLISILQITENLNVSNSSTLTLGNFSQLFIDGSLVIDQTSTLDLSENAKLNVTGCLNLSGTLHVQINSAESRGSVKVMNVSCGNISDENIILSNLDSCKVIESHSSQILNGQLVIQYSLVDSSICKVIGLQPWQIGSIVAAIIFLVVLVVAVVLMLNIRLIRQRVFPFRDRTMAIPNRAEPRESKPKI